jgi:hypothetical protein
MEPRRRVIARLRYLAGTAVGAASVTLGACYSVVDMLPEPAVCSDSSDWTTSFLVSATFRTVDGALALEVVVDTWEDVGIDDPDVAGGALVSREGTSFLVDVQEPTPAVVLTFVASCQEDPQSFQATIEVPDDVADGDAAVVTVEKL